MLSIFERDRWARGLAWREWLRFPANRIVDDARLHGIAAKAVWLVVPLEYYVLTRLSGGIATDSYVPTAVMALICVLAILAVSSALAIFYPRGGAYRVRVRGLTIALLTTWGTGLALLALSYFASWWWLGEPHDLFEDVVCRRRCVHYPLVNWETFISYAGYATLAAGLVSTAIRFFPVATQRANSGERAAVSVTPPRTERIAEPNLVLIVVIVAVVMMLLHRLSTVDQSSPIRFWGSPADMSGIIARPKTARSISPRQPGQRV
jgi:hypothetical protein